MGSEDATGLRVHPAASGARADLLRLSTAGSVDDGKSTLIGRLLLDTKQVMADQMSAVTDASLRRGLDRTDLALITDGLRAEREQGITIDVAYRYFHTPRRTFIVADTPGHEQYTPNMVTGASTSDLAVILVDARKGLTTQSRRHAFLSALLGIRHLVIAVNKMDLVDWSEARFAAIRASFEGFVSGLGVTDVTFVPVSALLGDNIVEPSGAMGWYRGPTLLAHLEEVQIARGGGATTLDAARFPVQWVIRPQSATLPDYRGYAGQVAGGVLRPGDEVVVLGSGRRTRIERIETHDGPVAAASWPMSVVVHLADDLDASRGDLIVGTADLPTSTQDLTVEVCWMSDRPLATGSTWSLAHTTAAARARVVEVTDRLDVDTLTRDRAAGTLQLNDIGLVRLRTTQPLHVDRYEENRLTGALILIDEATNTTVGAGLVRGT